MIASQKLGRRAYLKKNRLRRRRDENLIRSLNACNRQEAKCMFPFHFHFQLSKDVRTRLEISKYWIPWICCVVVLRSMKVNRQMLMSLSRSQGLFILGERRWVIYLSFFWRFQFDFIDAEYLIQFHNFALLFEKPSGSGKEINKRPPRLGAILPMSAFPPPLLWPIF